MAFNTHRTLRHCLRLLRDSLPPPISPSAEWLRRAAVIRHTPRRWLRRHGQVEVAAGRQSRQNARRRRLGGLHVDYRVTPPAGWRPLKALRLTTPHTLNTRR